jgi:hypothetical protein
MEDWMLSLSDASERSAVVDEESAEEFVRKVLAKDSSLGNFVDGVERQRPADFRQLVESDFVQGLIQENTDGVQKVRVKADVKKSEVRITKARSVASVVGSDSVLRREVLQAVFNPVYRTPTDDHIGLRSRRTGRFVGKRQVRVQQRLGITASLDRNMRPLYRNARTGRFVSQKALLRRINPYLLTHPAKKKEVERLLRRKKIED